MSKFRFEHPTPLAELINTAGQLDDDEQLDLQSPAEHVAAQEPEYISALGFLALQRAQEWLRVAYTCRDELVEQGLFEKSRKRGVDLTQSLPEFAAAEAQR